MLRPDARMMLPQWRSDPMHYAMATLEKPICMIAGDEEVVPWIATTEQDWVTCRSCIELIHA